MEKRERAVKKIAYDKEEAQKRTNDLRQIKAKMARSNKMKKNIDIVLKKFLVNEVVARHIAALLKT